MARRRVWFLNRVVLGLVAMLALLGLREFEWKPQYRGYYEAAIRLYQGGNFREAQQQLDKAYSIAPNAVDVMVMEGWTHLKLNQLEDARFYFTRAVRIDPRTDEAQIGLAFVALETGHGDLDPDLLERILKARKGDPNVMILLAGALEKQGRYFEAQKIYSHLLDNKDYSSAAQLALQNMFGLRGFSDVAPTSFAAIARPAELEIKYRAGDGAFWKTDAQGQSSKLYLQGVDLGAGAPGYLLTALPNEGAVYTQWLDEVSELNANALRVYTLLPPSFYRALHHEIAAGKQIALIQQIWVSDPPAQDLFDAGFEDHTKAEIRYVVDAIHGHGAVPPEPGRGSGVYEFDLAANVGAFLIGRDIDLAVIAKTNLLNAGERSYQGKYLSVAQASPTEVWLVEMADYLIDYETTTYNWQHPVAMLSGPAPDPVDADFLEDRVKQQPAFRAGLMAAYPAYPFYPDYMERDSQYASARDQQGVNPVAGFVRDLHARLTVPLLVSEYGVSNSMEPRRVLPSGWNQGGYSEDAQAEALGRLTRSLRESGSAGAMVFELADEWHRYGWIPEGFETPQERATLWLNDLDPAKRYGLIGYHTSKWQLFAGDEAAWRSAAAFYSSSQRAGESAPDAIRGVDVAADEGYLYLRLRVACLDCAGKSHTGKPQFDRRAFAIALNTLPGSAGIQQLPFGSVTLSAGANFLIVLRGPSDAQMLMADDYDPFQVVAREDDPRRQQLVYKRTFVAGVHPTGDFESVAVQQAYDLSQLRYGDGNPDATDYDSRGEWYADVKQSAILLRIPWGKLLVTDPSSMLALAGHDNGAVRARPTTGVQVSAYALEANAGTELNNMTVASAAPASGPPQVFSWRPWNTVAVAPFRKKAFLALQREYAQTVAMGQVNSPTPLAHGARLR